MTKFQGFSPKTLHFFSKLSRNNSRDWFHEHREEYVRFVQEPARLLAGELGEMVRELDSETVVEPHRIVSRIHRDTRFSKDKSPYRPRTFLAFRRNVERWSETPAFFVQIEETQYLYGMGIYGPPAAAMRRFREMIDDRPEYFLEIIEPFRKSKTLALESEKYKRSFPNEFSKEIRSKIEPWYQSKSIAVIGYRKPDKMLYSAKLVDFLIDQFVLLKPLYDFLWKSIKF